MAEEITIDGGLVVYFFAPLVGIFVGPLEAIAAVVGYWLLRGVEDRTDPGPNATNQ